MVTDNTRQWTLPVGLLLFFLSELTVQVFRPVVLWKLHWISFHIQQQLTAIFESGVQTLFLTLGFCFKNTFDFFTLIYLEDVIIFHHFAARMVLLHVLNQPEPEKAKRGKKAPKLNQIINPLSCIKLGAFTGGYKVLFSKSSFGQITFSVSDINM